MEVKERQMITWKTCYGGEEEEKSENKIAFTSAVLPCVGNIHSIYTVYFTFHLSIKAVWKQEVCSFRAAEYLLPLFGSFKYLGGIWVQSKPFRARWKETFRSVTSCAGRAVLVRPHKEWNRPEMVWRRVCGNGRNRLYRRDSRRLASTLSRRALHLSNRSAPPTAQQEKLQAGPPDVDPSRQTNDFSLAWKKEWVQWGIPMQGSLGKHRSDVQEKNLKLAIVVFTEKYCK